MAVQSAAHLVDYRVEMLVHQKAYWKVAPMVVRSVDWTVETKE